MILEGDMCEVCGEILDGDGFAQRCSGCSDEDDSDDDGGYF